MTVLSNACRGDNTVEIQQILALYMHIFLGHQHRPKVNFNCLNRFPQESTPPENKLLVVYIFTTCFACTSYSRIASGRNKGLQWLWRLLLLTRMGFRELPIFLLILQIHFLQPLGYLNLERPNFRLFTSEERSIYIDFRQVNLCNQRKIK